MYNRGIGILTFNRGNQIGNILESVLSTMPNSCKVVICDDGSTDNTFEEIK